MSWSTSWVCPDCDVEYVLEDETEGDFELRHKETCPAEGYEGD